MSLGFLTESALLPSKAKAIKVDSKSILDLKAVVFRKEQERQERRQRLAAAAQSTNGEVDNDDYHGKKRRRGREHRRGKGEVDRNRGVEKRRRRDEEERELDVEDRDDDAALQRKSREMLERKAQLYEELLQGGGRAVGSSSDGVSSAVASECLVDFDLKRREMDHGPVSKNVSPRQSRKTAVMVDIVDEFGRSRSVEQGGEAHIAFQRRQEQHLATPADDEVVKRTGGDGTERGDQGGGFVVSQWEQTLKSSEKAYLEQVHANTEQAKKRSSVLEDRQRRKQERLERLRQQSQTSTHRTTVPTRDSHNQEIMAANQATAFLRDMTALL